MQTEHTTAAQLTTSDFALVTLQPNGSVAITHWSGCWTTFNPSKEALELCDMRDRRRIFVHCRLNALTGRRGASDTLRYALTTVEMYVLQGAAE